MALPYIVKAMIPATAKNDAKSDVGGIYGWRKIARYLGVCERTAHRWSQEQGLPVASMPDRRVYTTRSLIDQWVLARHKLRHARLYGPPAEVDEDYDDETGNQ